MFHRALRDALEASQLPPLAFSELTAITTSHRNIPFRRDDEAPGTSRDIIARDVSRRFSALDIPLIAGRTIADDGHAQEIVVKPVRSPPVLAGQRPAGQAPRDRQWRCCPAIHGRGRHEGCSCHNASEIPPVVYRSLQSGGAGACARSVAYNRRADCGCGARHRAEGRACCATPG